MRNNNNSNSYVFFDLEWNQGYPRNEAEKIDEIIQIGAYRLADWTDEGSAYSAYVRPSIHKKLHHQVKKMLPLNIEELKQAKPFQQVTAEFFRWCGKKARFFTWGTCDARVLDTNLCWYGLEEYLDLEIYDLQRAFDLLVLETNHQTALETAVETLGLRSDVPYHDACNDATYTARIGAELVRRFGRLPSEEELDRAEEALRLRRRQEAAQEGSEQLGELVENAVPVLRRRCGSYESREEGLKSRSARVLPCPECGSLLCSGNWYRMGERYVARSRCMEHGRFFSVLSFCKQENRYSGELRVYPEELFGTELFQLCKLGGEVIEVRQMPRKHRRPRRGKVRLKPDRPKNEG